MDRSQDLSKYHMRCDVDFKESDARGVPIAGMDGLRACGCLAVFGVHWQQMTRFDFQVGPFEFGRLLENGNTGVALFMILSGFLLARPWFTNEGISSTQKSIKQYFWNRLGRILPAYGTSLLSLVLLRQYWQSPSEWLDVGLHFVFMHNFSSQTLYSINPPFWALAVIVQFYVYLGLLISLLRWTGKLSHRTLLGAIVSLALLSQLLVGILSSIDPSSQWSQDWLGPGAVCLDHSLLSHLSLFSLGAVAASIHARIGSMHRQGFDVAVIISAGLLFVVLATPLDDILHIPGGRYNFPFVPFLLTVIVLGVSWGISLPRFLETVPLRRLGAISYGFYLFHLPIMQIMLKVAYWQGITLVEQPFLFAALSAAMTALACELSFHGLERPLGNWLRKSGCR